MSLADSRKRFNELRDIRRTGANPKQLIEQEINREQHTVEKLVLAWYTGYIEKNRKKPLQIKQQIDADIIPLLGNMELDKLQPMDITKAIGAIVKRGAPIHANRVLGSLKQAFNCSAAFIVPTSTKTGPSFWQGSLFSGF